MAEDTTGWSEKGKRAKGAAEGEGGSKTPQRPSKRQASSGGKGEAESSVVRTPSSDGARKVAKAAATAGQRDVSFASRLGFPALVALICLLGIGVVVLARSSREAVARPQENIDHWHSVYGVYNCNSTGEGDAKYLPPFQSTDDDFGIHSHGDGVLHIHPFVSAASGSNAQMRHWLNEMKVTVDPERISVQNQFDPSAELVAGQECIDGTGKAEIKVLRWQFDIEARGVGEDLATSIAESPQGPEVITEDFGLINFRNDREVFIFAYMGENTNLDDIPLPPAERFNTLNNVSAALEFEPTALNPIDTGVEADTDAGDSDTADTDADDS